MSESAVNIPLLRKAVEWAEAEADRPLVEREWMQSNWISTPRDIAIEVAYREGCTYRDGSLRQRAEELAPSCGTAYCIAGYIAQALDARYAAASEVGGIHSSQAAADALGIPLHILDGGLFAANNSIADVRRIAESLAGERL